MDNYMTPFSYKIINTIHYFNIKLFTFNTFYGKI